MPNPKYRPNKKNGGNAPVAKDARVLLVPIGCKKCIECKKQKAREWQVRLQEEIRNDKNGKFVTLTFSNDSIKNINEKLDYDINGYERDNAIATYAVRHFLERWRKKYKKSIKHWFITEIGGNGTENIHIHGLVWTTEKNEEISKYWKYGGITIGRKLYIDGKARNNNDTGYVSEETINYISKYVTKTDIKHKEYSAIILSSPGIGRNYTNRLDAMGNKYNKEGGTNEAYTTRNGTKLAMPIYYRNKIYNDEEREKLWIEKLDKQERYVLGNKIDISKGEEEYYRQLKRARSKNKRLGYGDDEKKWRQEEYENGRRAIMLEQRINKGKDSPPPEKGES